MSPTISTKTKEEKRVLKSRQALEREKLIFYGVIAGCALTVLAHLVYQIGGLSNAGSRNERELTAFKTEHLIAVEEDLNIFNDELDIAKRARGENLAAENREEEFKERRNLDPSFAFSEREKAMLEMKSLGQDTEGDRSALLKKIAKLASPPRSGVAVTRTKKGYEVEVAFPYDYVTDKYRDRLRTYSEGYYYEVRREAAAIMKDMMAFGKDLGVSKVTVSCQHQVTVKARGRDSRKEFRNLFMVEASGNGRDWQRMTRSEVEDVWKKRTDSFPAMLKGR